MSEDEFENLSVREQLLKQHKVETKELQGKILQLKKSINKDKKRKKEVLDEIASLEKNLLDQHASELAEIESSTSEKEKPDEISIPNGIDSLQIGDTDSHLVEIEDETDKKNHTTDDTRPSTSAGLTVPWSVMKDDDKKISKAQKRREKKTQASKEREKDIKEAEKLNKFCARNVEAGKIKAILKEKNLQMHEINPDGNCLYAAIAHQLGKDATIEELRSQAASFMRLNMDDFLPFITDPTSGNLLTPVQFEEYCKQLESTSAWGGQPELRALSQTLNRRIEVVQADSAPIIFGEEFTSDKELQLAYYRHYYGLGEHYNSVEMLQPGDVEEKECDSS